MIDIAIIGSGAAGTHCLLNLLEQLPISTDSIRIAVIDRDTQFHCGIPYGNRSAPTSLLITRLADFLPQPDLTAFTRWLNEHREHILTTMRIDREWVNRHKQDIRNGNWENLYIPRRLYGDYLHQKTEAAIQRARELNIAIVDHFVSDITDIVTHCDGTSTVHGSADFKVRALTTVLAIGSPPVKRLKVTESHNDAGRDDRLLPHDAVPTELAETISRVRSGATTHLPGYISDIHSPTVEDALDRVGDSLRSVPREQRRILVVGGNADALEFVLASAVMRAETGATLAVLSPQGRPHYWRHEHPGEQPDLDAVQAVLDAIEAGERPRAHHFMKAVERDVANSITSGRDNATVSAIMAAVGPVIEHMDETELAEMAASCGLRVSNLLRQAGGDAIDLLDAANADTTVTFEQGHFDSADQSDSMYTVMVNRSDAKHELRSADTSSEASSHSDHGGSGLSAPVTLPQKYAVIVNATGFETVSTTRSPLLQRLLRNGVASVSQSNAGLATDGQFRAADGIYVLGPLLSGFHHDRTVIWHVESVSRIISLAAQLAPLLIEDTLNRRQPPVASGLSLAE